MTASMPFLALKSLTFLVFEIVGVRPERGMVGCACGAYVWGGLVGGWPGRQASLVA